MALRDTLLPEFDIEMANTRKSLERIPEEKLGWKPHPKSWALGELATHLANIPHWTALTLEQDSYDVTPPGAPPPRTPLAKSRQEVLASFDKNIASARAALAQATDEQLFKPWTLLAGGKTMMTLPRITVLRRFVLSHNIHHRAQLGVYLRLNDVPVLAIYGPSADESGR